MCPGAARASALAAAVGFGVAFAAFAHQAGLLLLVERRQVVLGVFDLMIEPLERLVQLGFERRLRALAAAFGETSVISRRVSIELHVGHPHAARTRLRMCS